MRTIYRNGQVYTGEFPLVTAFVVEDGRFRYAGSDAGAMALAGEEDEVCDLQGRFVCAGFNDSHMHLVNFGYALQKVSLAAHTGSLEEMLQAVRDFIARNEIEAGKWVCGRGWNQDYFSGEKTFPTRRDLDRISTEHPICLTRTCGHACVVNTKALELIGVTSGTMQLDGGRYETEADGTPNGVFRENAMELVYAKLPEASCEDIKEMILTASEALNRYGITSSQTDDLLVFANVPYGRILQAYEELAAEGRMTVRVCEQSQFMELDGLKKFIADGYHTGAGDAWFRIGPLKLLGDGSLGARTAYMSQPYADDPSTRGIAIFSRAQFDEMIGYANAHGMQVAVHAIGDGILDDILASYEKALAECPRADHRHGVVHCQIMRPEQAEKFMELSLHAYIQSIFLDYDIHIVEERVGSERAASSYAFRTLYEHVHTSNGSDCPVELPRVLAGIQCAVTRRSLGFQRESYLPEQALTVQQALDSFTVEGAYASFEEQVKGKIQPGMYADFVVLQENPFEAAPSRLSEIAVLETYVDGVCRYKMS